MEKPNMYYNFDLLIDRVLDTLDKTNLLEIKQNIFKNAKGVNDESVEDLKAKVSVQFFPELVRMIKQIEQKMINLDLILPMNNSLEI